MQEKILQKTYKYLHKKYKFHYKNLLTPILKTILCLVIMLGCLLGLKQVYFSFDSVVNSFATISIFTICGAFIYFILAFKLRLIDDIFG